MELVRFEPIPGYANFRSVFGGLFNDNLGRSSAQSSVSMWHPAVDVLENQDSYLIRAELPGMKREDIKVEFKDGTLVLSGERKSEKPAEDVEYRHVERRGALQLFRAISLAENAQTITLAAPSKNGDIWTSRLPDPEAPPAP